MEDFVLEKILGYSSKTIFLTRNAHIAERLNVDPYKYLAQLGVVIGLQQGSSDEGAE